jgi:benzylsuccinate CoA-transferase BbsF subunit
MESATRPDVLRLAQPAKDGIPGLDRSQFFADYNSSKLGLALNLATDEGRTIALRVIEWADVVIESFTPGTMVKLGLDPDSILAERPDLIWYSTCLLGQTGPYATFAGFGQQGSAIAGIHGITGWPDRAPTGTWGAYTDMIAPHYGGAALASAILERRETGLGQRIDMSQVEAAMHFMEPAFLNYTVNGHVAQSRGLDSEIACPHSTYQTQGTERYIAIACETDEQWEALCGIAPLDEFTHLEDLKARLSRRKAIDEALVAWCADREPFELEAELAAAGVPASVAQFATDLYEDPQVAHRGFFVTLNHTVMGPTPYDGLITRFSAKQEMLHKAAPIMGEDTVHVLTEFLGMSADEIAVAAIAGALS